jgi:hypothetical protein
MDTTKLTTIVRTKRAKEILNISNENDKLILYISSRPDDIFSGWEHFSIYKLNDLTKSQVELLVKKLPCDDEIKDLFFKKMESGLYKTHQEFLVNPLLVIMMAVTLEQFAEIPGKNPPIL